MAEAPIFRSHWSLKSKSLTVLWTKKLTHFKNDENICPISFLAIFFTFKQARWQRKKGEVKEFKNELKWLWKKKEMRRKPREKRKCEITEKWESRIERGGEIDGARNLSFHFGQFWFFKTSETRENVIEVFAQIVVPFLIDSKKTVKK